MGFEEYVEEKRKIQNIYKAQPEQSQQLKSKTDELYDQQKQRALTRGGDDEFSEESMDFMLSETTFDERTEYYFKEQGLLEAKEVRYKTLSDERYGELAEFARVHTNRSASKRKDSAKAAAKKFKKAALLMEAENKTASDFTIETYRAREEIIRMRMEGMIEAAKVKSTSKEDEKYRIAKAKLKCLSILHDQLVNLRNGKQKNDFDKAEKKLLKEIGSAQKELKKCGIEKRVDDKWHREDKMDFNRINMHPCYYVKKDENGKPINKTEEKKEQWNKRWLSVVSDKGKQKERTRLLEEAYRRYEKMELPDLKEVKEKGALHVLEKDPATILSTINFVLTMDKMGEKEPFVKEYRNSHKSFAAKMVIWSRFANLLLLEAEKKHLVTKSDNDGVWSINLHRQSNENDEGIENYNEKHQEYLNKLEEIYVPLKDVLKRVRVLKE